MLLIVFNSFGVYILFANICYRGYVIFDDLMHLHIGLSEHNHTHSPINFT